MRVMLLATCIARAAHCMLWRWMLMLIGGVCAVGYCGYRGGELWWSRTSGKVPLEKTLLQC